MCGLFGSLAPTEYDLSLGFLDCAGPGLLGLRVLFTLFPVTALVDGDLRLPFPIGAVVVDMLIALLPLRPFFVWVCFIGDCCAWWGWALWVASWTVSKQFEVLLVSSFIVMSLIKSSAFITRAGCPCGCKIIRHGPCTYQQPSMTWDTYGKPRVSQNSSCSESTCGVHAQHGLYQIFCCQPEMEHAC